MAMLDDIVAVLTRPLNERLERIMASLEELEGKVTALSGVLTDAKTRITADVDHLRTLIEGLQAQVAAGAVDQATVDRIAASVDAITMSVEAIDPDPAFPPPEPPPPEG